MFPIYPCSVFLFYFTNSINPPPHEVIVPITFFSPPPPILLKIHYFFILFVVVYESLLSGRLPFSWFIVKYLIFTPKPLLYMPKSRATLVSTCGTACGAQLGGPLAIHDFMWEINWHQPFNQCFFLFSLLITISLLLWSCELSSLY